MGYVLIVDDESDLCMLMEKLVTDRGHAARSVASAEAALEVVGECRPDLVLLDVCLGGMDGLEALRRLQPLTAGTPIVMMTAFGNVPTAVAAMRLGATDFLSKPFRKEELLSTIEALLAMRGALRGDAPTLIGESPAFRKAMELAQRFAVPDINILLVGETGTGKELFARAIHAQSKRRSHPFIAVDCSMLAENLIESELFGHEKGAFTGATDLRVGWFEMAQGGTLFLDEIGNLPSAVQAKLLRVLQERRMERVGGRDTIKLDVRVVAATNVNLKDGIAAGSFRTDLYYRLQEMTICLPPLRERCGDLRPIARYFVTVYAERFATGVRDISDDALEMLEAYHWPGNVRELENAIKSSVVLATDVVRPEHLPPDLRIQATGGAVSPVSSETDDEQLKLEIEIALRRSRIDLKALGAAVSEQAERQVLAALLRRRRMSSAQLAKLLGVDPKTLRTKLRKYGLELGRNDLAAAG